MHIKRKINLKKYFLLSLATTAFCCFFAKHAGEIIAIIVVYIATILNQFMLVESIAELMSGSEQDTAVQKNDRKGAAIFMFLGKFLILGAGLTFGVQFMGNRIIIPLLNYVIIIFILVLSMNKEKD